MQTRGTRPATGNKMRTDGKTDRGRRFLVKPKVCAFCVDKTKVDFKDVSRLRKYISERGKIEPRRRTGACAKHQRGISLAIKRARYLALLPYTASHFNQKEYKERDNRDRETTYTMNNAAANATAQTTTTTRNEENNSAKKNLST
jgi:small subunit ribosomal protein S18